MHIYDIIHFIIKPKKRQRIENIFTYFYIKVYKNKSKRGYLVEFNFGINF